MPDTIESRINAQKAVVDGLITAANNKTGDSFTDLPAAVQELIDGYHSGGEDPAVAPFIQKMSEYSGETLMTLAEAAQKAEDSVGYWISNRKFHPKIAIWPYTSLNGYFQSSTVLKKLICPTATTTNESSCLKDCSALEELYMPMMNSLGTGNAINDTSLKVVQIGSVGHPFTQASPKVDFFENCTQDFLTITMYVNDDAILPCANAPWGATNATIIYRSATTGEVIPVA